MSETCYGHTGPNAVFLPNYGPCNPQQDSVSLCCEIGETCLTNGLCVTQSGVYYNGGCTDSTYKSAVCPTFCTSGDENWVVECHGSVVNNGDFCCSVNGTITTCCNTASNGLGLVAPVSSAQAVSATFVGGSIVPTSSISGVIASSFGSLTSTSVPTATPQSNGSAGMPRSRKIDIGVGVVAGVGTVSFIIFCVVRRWIKRREGRPPAGTIVELDDRLHRREESNKSGTHEQPSTGIIPNEVEGSTPGPSEMDANQTRAAPTSPASHGSDAHEVAGVAPENIPLREPSATPGSWYSRNLGTL